MVCTQIKKASFVKVEEEAEFYHRTNLEDTLIMMENSLEAEGIDHMMELTNDKEGAVTRFEEGMCKLKKSQNNYLINGFAININEVQ